MAGGGAGGTPNGEAGAAGSDGNNDGSTNYGGAGGNSPFGLGGTSSAGAPTGTPGGVASGGGGASSPDRTDPLNWAGGAGGDGIIAFVWGDEVDLPSQMPASVGQPVPAVIPTSGPTGSAGGGGGKIICTKLYELGLMSEEIYLADQAFGAQLVQIRPDIYNGYRAWAEIVVDWMSGSGPKMMPWMSDEEFSVAAKKWSISWAQDIATPWAEEMAFKMGKKSEGSLTGRMITAAGIPICKAVGVWQRIFGPSKKPAGFIKGLGLIAIFIMFKIVAELGRLFEGKKEHVYSRSIN